MAPQYSRDDLSGSELAIIGMAGRFPGASNIEEFWRNIRAGVESTAFYSDKELRAAGVDAALIESPNFVKAAAMLKDIDHFDAPFFGYTPREAEAMDPQHRLFLESAWEALENAGYDCQTYGGLIGIYAGSGFCSYLLNNLISNREILELIGELQAAVGNERDSLASTVSYKLNLKGPSLAVQTFCSTSLVAVHLACQSLLNYECDMALAGGVAITCPQGFGYLYQPGGIASPDGRTRTFDAMAQGSLMGNGLGIVVLKRQEDALTDGDEIHAVIKGSAINNDGSLKVGYTAPGLEGQTAVIVEALSNAGVSAETISYIEAHGTATPLGDSIEMAAATKAFRTSTEKKGFCAIGSVKTNIGHLDRASGVTGLIKTVLALKHGELPPSLHFDCPNPDIDFRNSPFYVSTKLTKWERNGTPRRAGVSSFGLGGTNAHVILEEASSVEAPRDVQARASQLIVLSTKTSAALDTATENLSRYLKSDHAMNVADIAYTLQVGRAAFSYRRALVCNSSEEAIKYLETMNPERVSTVYQEQRGLPVVFMYPGVGEQYEGMGRGLYEREETFRRELDKCSELLSGELGRDLREVVFGGESREEKGRSEAGERVNLRGMVERRAGERGGELERTRYAQPAVFAVSYALTRLLEEWGLRPAAMIGYSVGEYVAATVSGVMKLEEALLLVARRARLIEEEAGTGGGMLAVPLSEEETRAVLEEAGVGREATLGAVNGERLSVVSGRQEALAEVESRLLEQGVVSRRLTTQHAFHSPLLECVRERYEELVGGVELGEPGVPYVSNLSGEWVRGEEVRGASYWGRQMCQPVRFGAGLERLLSWGAAAVVEVGPGQALSSMVRQTAGGAERVVVSTLPGAYERQSDEEHLTRSLGRLWVAGVEVDWQGYHRTEQRRRVALPTYPFERQRYWIEGKTNGQQPHRKVERLEQLAKHEDIADWFYLPSWKQAPLMESRARRKSKRQQWLVFIDDSGIGCQVVKRLETDGQMVSAVKIGKEFAKLGPTEYSINPKQRDDYRDLLADLDDLPTKVVHCWSLTRQVPAGFDREHFAQCQEIGLYSVINLAKAIGNRDTPNGIEIIVLSSNTQRVTGEEELNAEMATLLAPCKVIPQEYSNISCRSVDITLPGSGSWQEKRLIAELCIEFASESSESVVAYRGGSRWVQRFESLCLGDVETTKLRPRGVYIITGGLGGVGLILARHLAHTVQARLVLTGRSALPDRTAWEEWLTTHEQEDRVSGVIREVRALEELGSDILVVTSDVSDESRMREVFDLAEERFGEIHGVIHAAGVSATTAFRLIQEVQPEHCELHFQPKVYGLYALERILRGRQLDFCLIFSSLSSFLGGLSFVGYAAANIFMDAFTARHNQTDPEAWLSVNWDSWQTGRDQHKVIGKSLAAFEMTPAEGAEAFQRVISGSPVRQLINSTGDFHARIAQWVNSKPLSQTSASQNAAGTYPRPNLQNPFIPPANELEKRIAGIWQMVLGIEKVGIHDNFFDLGGTSLTGLQVITRIQKELGVQVSPSDFLEVPTVNVVAGKLTLDARP
jgi:acyl transferase domain-containing protein/NAD(P)-dependent dehydrogenase (short-subunit alcohol dehydrogenase family)/acyl carrier protein